MEDQSISVTGIPKLELGHTGVYYEAGSNIPFKVSEMFNNEGRLRNSSTAGLHLTDLQRSESRSQRLENIETDYFENDHKDGYRLSTTQLDATRKYAANWNTSTDDIADNTPDTADNIFDTAANELQFVRGIPRGHWQKFLTDGSYPSLQWPRISLRASYKRKDPYRTSADEEEVIETPAQEEDRKGKSLKTTLCVVIVGLILVVSVALPVFIVSMLTEKDESTFYVKATMRLTVKDNYTISLGNSSSNDFINFGNQFCNEITQIYENGSLKEYYGCRVKELRDGSIIVIFLVYFTNTQLDPVNNNVKQILIAGLTVNGYFLGNFEIDIATISVISVVIESLTSPPPIQGAYIPTDLSPSLEATTSFLEVSSSVLPTRGSNSSQLETNYTLATSESMEEIDTTYQIDQTTYLQPTTDTTAEMLHTSTTTQLETSVLSTSVESQIQIETTLISHDSISILSIPIDSKISILTTTSIQPSQVDSYTINSTFLSVDDYNTSLSISDTVEILETEVSNLSLTGSMLSFASTTLPELSSHYTTEPLTPSIFANESITPSITATKMTGTQIQSSLDTLTITEVNTGYLLTEETLSFISTIAENETRLYDGSSNAFKSSTYSDEILNSPLESSVEYFGTETILRPSTTIGSITFPTTSSVSSLESVSLSLPFDTQLLTSIGFNTESVSVSFLSTYSDIPSFFTTESFNASFDSTDMQTSFLTTEVQPSLFITEVQSSFVTTEFQSSFVTTEVQSSLVTTDLQSSLLTTEVQSLLLTTGVQSSLLTTDAQSSLLLTTELQSSVLNTEVQSSVLKTELQSSVLTTDMQSSLLTLELQSSLLTTEVHSSLFSTDKQSSFLSAEMQPSLFTTDMQSSFLTTELLTTELQSSVLNTEVQSSLLTTELQSSVLTTNMQSSLLTTELQSSFLTTEVQSSLLSTDKQSSFLSADMQPSLFTTDMQSSFLTTELLTTELQSSVLNTEVESSLFTTELQSSVLTTDMQSSLLTTERQSSLLTTEVQSSLFSTNKQSSFLSAEMQPSLFTTDMQSSFLTTEMTSSFGTTELQSSLLTTKPLNSYTELVTEYSTPIDISSFYTTSSTSMISSSLAFNITVSGISCNSIEERLYSGPKEMICIIGNVSFEKIAIFHASGNDTIFAAELHVNGSVNIMTPNQGVLPKFDGNANVLLTFENISCNMNGSYQYALLDNSNNLQASTTAELFVVDPPEVPTLDLNADQVVDLVFPDGNYYREGREHSCESNVGFPPGQLEIDIMYANASVFQNIPTDQITINRTRISTVACQNRERIIFPIRFTEDMDGATLRCRIPVVQTSINEYRINATLEKLSLIPRNICSCAVNGGRIGHPKRCDAYVQCIEDNNIMYPLGAACTEGTCRNSISGMCSDDCSAEVCNEQVPSDFCVSTPSPPPVLSSTYIFCNDSTAEENSGPVDIKCTLNINSTDIAIINITFRTDTTNNQSIIASIQADGSITYLQSDINVMINDFNRIIITLPNATCSVSGLYGVAIGLNSGETETAEGTLSITNPPEVPNLILNADQVIDLVFPDGNFYRGGREHHCESIVGSLAGNLEIDIMYANSTTFQSIASNRITIPKQDTSTVNCQIRKKIYFAIRFTEDMDDAVLRCRVVGVDSILNGTLQTLALIPRNICSCAANGDSIGHPKRCDAYVTCKEDNNIMYPLGVACDDGMCRNSISGICSNNCSAAVCTEEVPKDLCVTTSSPPQVRSSTFVSCNNQTVDENSGPVNISCTLDINSTDVAVVNITYRTDISKIPSNLAQIQSDGGITYLQSEITIFFNDFNTIIIAISNATCGIDGLYGVAIGFNSEDIDAAEGTLTIINHLPSGVPILTLDTDQVIDLVFPPSGAFYRTEGLHICESNVGFPPYGIDIDIMYANTSSFQSIPSDIFIIVEQDTSIINCQNRRKIYFAIKFTEEMDDAVLRCMVTGVANPINGTSETLALIPRNICFCAGNGDTIGHPKRCDAYVRCLEYNNIMYPLGAPCSVGTCRNSTSGICTNNCSDEACNEDVPKDFCTPTTTMP